TVVFAHEQLVLRALKDFKETQPIARLEREFCEVAPWPLWSGLEAERPNDAIPQPQQQPDPVRHRAKRCSGNGAERVRAAAREPDTIGVGIVEPGERLGRQRASRERDFFYGKRAHNVPR